MLDLGCNSGRFSLLAASLGKSVVAIDKESAAVGNLWRRATEGNADILPLVVDIARPFGGVGWANQECTSFLDRARGRFDCVLALALVHHLLVSERAPLGLVFDLLQDITTRFVIVEYVDPSDAQFQRLLRGREALHAELSRAAFEAAARKRFEVIRSCELTPTRIIYVLSKRN